ncbi:M20 metallopeptidase family protein [Zhihengliuella halotolerans]|uniref:Hippurate hydrolase n=1 Tax=Zhihengliuella halotolerans TaxID=370736 RepID=A0A4Q8A9V5_9MICC|nr:M20 family metallopeptidase [Zhihengliuella halotolerans]RZU60862.1 hippurate hydrolase [Zhihengliuella halotolerans]
MTTNRLNEIRPGTTEPGSAIPDFAAEANHLLPELVALRRAIHADPELGLDLPRTQRRVLDTISDLGLELTLGQRTTSIVALLRGALPGPTIVLRGDMDALPIREATNLDFSSTNGNMHACGHDLHTAGLVGAARLLSAHRDVLPGNVIFMFQPGEEGHGGAKVMLEEGLLDVAGERPVAAYAIHVAPGPKGVFATRSGAICAGSNELEVVITGRGGHGSQPHQTIDPVPVAAELVMALQTFVTRRFDAFDPVILSVTRLDTGAGALNVIPEQARIAATVRSLSATSLERLKIELPRLVDGIAQAHGCSATMDFTVLYPVTTNDPSTTQSTMDDLRVAFGNGRVMEMETPMMGSEDFSFVLDEVPGTFIAMLTSPDGTDPSTVEFNHSPRVIFDDSVLGDQAAALATVAYQRLVRQ